jgi:hypothetical protein
MQKKKERERERERGFLSDTAARGWLRIVKIKKLKCKNIRICKKGMGGAEQERFRSDTAARDWHSDKRGTAGKMAQCKIDVFSSILLVFLRCAVQLLDILYTHCVVKHAFLLPKPFLKKVKIKYWLVIVWFFFKFIDFGFFVCAVRVYFQILQVHLEQNKTIIRNLKTKRVLKFCKLRSAYGYLMGRSPLNDFCLWRHHVLSTAPPFIFWWWKFKILFYPPPLPQFFLHRRAALTTYSNGTH